MTLRRSAFYGLYTLLILGGGAIVVGLGAIVGLAVRGVP